jgi:hypothetical protein
MVSRIVGVSFAFGRMRTFPERKATVLRFEALAISTVDSHRIGEGVSPK